MHESGPPSTAGSHLGLFSPRGHRAASWEVCGHHDRGAPGIEWVGPGMLSSPYQPPASLRCWDTLMEPSSFPLFPGTCEEVLS